MEKQQVSKARFLEELNNQLRNTQPHLAPFFAKPGGYGHERTDITAADDLYAEIGSIVHQFFEWDHKQD